MRKNIIAANWKMNHTTVEINKFFTELKLTYKPRENVLAVVAPTSVYLSEAVRLAEGVESLYIASQNMYFEASGAFTGELSAAMLKDVGAQFVILGHSERRHIFGESDELIAKKVKAALDNGLTPIFCIGELLEEREAGNTSAVVSRQIKAVLPGLSVDEVKKTVIAYEPVWAIGTGKTATPQQAQEVHALVRGMIAESFDDATANEVTIQYGGSVKPDNVDELMSAPDIDGALVGGSSLKAESFQRLIDFKK